MPKIRSKSKPSSNGKAHAPTPRKKKPDSSRGEYIARKNRISKGESVTLEQLKNEYQENYYFSDPEVIDIVLGIVASNHFDSDPIWLHLISAPSGGKTELLLSLMECEETYFISDFTANSLISGYKDEGKKSKDKKAKQTEDFSLLPKLNGKVAITKDFTLIHQKPSEARSQILSILRDVYDGYASRALGNSQAKGYHSRFNYLTGMTPDIEKNWSLNTLGERFLMLRIQIEDRREHARQSLRNANKSNEIRKKLQAKVKSFIESIPKDIEPEVPEGMEEKILDLADLLSTCRTFVYRERNDEMTFLPVAELASRVLKQLLRVGQAVALVRGKTEVSDAEFQVMKRIALDSLPTNRRHILKALSDQESPQEIKTFEQATGLSKTSVKRLLEDLRSLKVVKRHKLKNVSKTKPPMGYVLSKQFQAYCRNIGGIPSP